MYLHFFHIIVSTSYWWVPRSAISCEPGRWTVFRSCKSRGEFYKQDDFWGNIPQAKVWLWEDHDVQHLLEGLNIRPGAILIYIFFAWLTYVCYDTFISWHELFISARQEFMLGSISNRYQFWLGMAASLKCSLNSQNASRHFMQVVESFKHEEL